MTFKEEISGKSKSPTAIFHRYRVDTSAYNRVHLFVEGYEDVGFYSYHVPQSGDMNAKFHVCFGKKNLDFIIKLYRNSRIEAPNTLFIRDSDFDKYLGTVTACRDLFLTCGYSVENYVCGPDVLQRFLLTVFCIEEDPVRDDAVEEFSNICLRFHDWVAPLYGAAMYAVRNERNVDLDKFSASVFYDFYGKQAALPDIVQVLDLERIGLTAGDFNEDSEKIAADYRTLDPIYWTRGKYILELISIFIRKLAPKLLAMQKTGQIRTFNRKAMATLDEVSVYQKLCSFAGATKDLRDFLCVQK